MIIPVNTCCYVLWISVLSKVRFCFFIAIGRVKQESLLRLQLLYFPSGRQIVQDPFLEYPDVLHIFNPCMLQEERKTFSTWAKIFPVCWYLDHYLRLSRGHELSESSFPHFFSVEVYDYLLSWFSTLWYLPDVLKGVSCDKTPFMTNFQHLQNDLHYKLFGLVLLVMLC